MYNPVSTYRIQFHKGFTFKDLEGIIPYLIKLGVKTLYASPIFSAVPGSNHGYDGTDPLSINAEVGTLNELRVVSAQLKNAGIGWLQDIVPNHMAFHHHNKWLMDLMKNGPDSPYKDYFDQSLADESFFKGPLMVPFLGDDLETVIANRDLQIVSENNEYFFAYADQRWPLNHASASQLKPDSLAKINVDSEVLFDIASNQYYRLSSWKETDNTINFRRFFTVNSLICINIERQHVFDDFHRLIAALVKEGVFQGLRIDHIDGLYDPQQYLQRLRDLVGTETYIVVEKILAANEQLPQWPIQGTTGYDFLAQVNNLFTKKKSKKTFTRFYERLTGAQKPAAKQVPKKKKLILTSHMNGELENLTKYYLDLGLGNGTDITEIKKGIADLLIDFPVYRFYGNKWPLNDDEKLAVTGIIGNGPLKALFEEGDGMRNQNAQLFYQRCMQFSGPLMAKGVEDTLMYTYNRFIAHNEVGDSPELHGCSVEEFHQLMVQRQQQWPLALNGTSTHDTKRGEDVRARLNVLSAFENEWLEEVDSWRKLNANLKHDGAPDDNDEYFIYQTLVGIYPMPGDTTDGLNERLEAYLQKALREGKRRSSWANPDEQYEASVNDFVHQILDEKHPFLQKFAKFCAKIARAGVNLSLAQVTLKFTCPGVPDVYQGCEMWDLSMVDPDNRRPVDYGIRKKYLSSINASLSTLLDQPFDGQLKLKLTQKLFELRSTYEQLFEQGEYIPLKISGKHRRGIIAFARRYKENWLVTIAPLRPNTNWSKTYVSLPPDAPSACENLLTEALSVGGNINVAEALIELPISILSLKHSDNERSAGVLLHITSLASKFGIGDFGPTARQFAEQLKAANQRRWQILPLNSVSAADAYSPYSATSSRAGNILLISPEQLEKQGLLTPADIAEYSTKSGHVDFNAAAEIKLKLFKKAWQAYTENPTEFEQTAFKTFCDTEADWMEDFALYSVLKDIHDQAPWYEWEEKYKFRNKQAVSVLSKENADSVAYVKWLQFIFNQQWNDLKSYCNGLGINIFGDLPFYISYDSADVWAQPEIFDLDEHLQMVNVSGVPPDYFNENGQRWGTPVYNWEKLKATGYDWWIKRIRKNLQWYDILRLDHFRAFAAYWAVPASEDTAIYGKWIDGPGANFFKALQGAFPELPLVAEDLGDIDDAVHSLKDQFNLPGMKVLQFAFGDEVAASDYAPHHHGKNYFVYTGTHDNNTMRGWFRHDADKAAKKSIKQYFGAKITENKVSDRSIRAAFASVCNTAIIPVQDWLNLDEQARMNTPAGDGENWTWQLTDEQLSDLPWKKMKQWTILYDRA